MSYPLYVNKHKPLGLWMLDNTTPFTDQSGRGLTGKISTGLANNAVASSVVSSAAYSAVLDKNHIAEFNTGLYQPGTESSSFVLESWVYPMTKSAGLTAQAYRENLILNPRTQSIGGTYAGTGTSNGTPTFAQVDVTVPSGYYSRTASSSAGSVGIGFFSNTQPNGTYTASYWVRLSVAGTWNIYSTEGTATEVGAVGTQVLAANTWTLVKFTFTVTAPGTIKIGGYFTAAAAGVTVDMSSIMLETGTIASQSYFDGTLTGYEWSGTAHNSVSRTRIDVNAVNLCKIPSVDTLTYIGAGGQANSTFTLDTNTYYSNGSSVKVTSIHSGAYAAILTNTGTTLEPVLSGQTYTLSVRAYVPAGNPDIQLQIFGTSMNGGNGPVNSTKNQWVTLSYTFTPSISGYPGIGIVGTASTAGQVFYIDAFRLTPGTDTTYFDGNSAGAGWSGTSGTSTSYMYVSAGQQQLLSNNGVYDGLIISGSKIGFGVQFNSAGMAYTEYDFQTPRSMYVVGIYNPNKIELWVNNQLVGDTELTAAQKMDSFKYGNGKLYSGGAVSGQALAVNAVAMYQELSPTEIGEHYAAGTKYLSQQYIAPANFGESVDLVAKNAFLSQQYDTELDFATGILTNATIAGDQLAPYFSSDTSQAGSWLTIIPLTPDSTSTYAVVVDWVGSGAIVESSLDGVTWTTVTRNVPLTNVGTNVDLTDKNLWVRVSFPGGVLNDPSYLTNLRIFAYSNNVATNSLTRNVTLTYPAIVMEDYEPIEYNERNGVALNGSILTVAADTSGMSPITVEFWIKPLTTGVTFNFSGTTYRNGVVYTNSLVVGEWQLVHIVAGSAIAGNLVFTGNGTVGQISLYPNALSAGTISQIYSSYTNIPSLRVTDTVVGAVFGSSDNVYTYAHDWEIVTSS